MFVDEKVFAESCADNESDFLVKIFFRVQLVNILDKISAYVSIFVILIIAGSTFYERYFVSMNVHTMRSTK